MLSDPAGERRVAAQTRVIPLHCMALMLHVETHAGLIDIPTYIAHPSLAFLNWPKGIRVACFEIMRSQKYIQFVLLFPVVATDAQQDAAKAVHERVGLSTRVRQENVAPVVNGD